MFFLFLFKLIIISLLLKYFKVFDVYSFIAYVFGAFVLYYFNPVSFIPEYLLFYISLIYVAYLFFISVKNNLFNVKNISKKQLFGVLNYFFVGFFLSYLLLPVFRLTNAFFLFLSIFVASFLFQHINIKKSKFLEKKSFKFINYFSVSVILFLELLVLNKWDMILYSFNYGMFYFLLIVIYFLIFSSFTMDVLVSELKVGMLPAEQISKKDKQYFKSTSRHLSFQNFLVQKAVKKLVFDSEVIVQRRALSKGDILMIQKISKVYGFDTFKIQRRIDMRLFVFAGIIISLVFV